MLVLSEADLRGLLPPSEIIAAVEAAVRAQDAGEIVVPQRLHLHWERNTLLTMPAIAAGGLGVKLISVVPSNAARGLPVTNGIMTLNDGETGMPLALMNAAALTAQRTGGVGALGVKHTTPQHITSVGIVGCGVQAVWQAIFACSVRPITQLFLYSRSRAGFKHFAATLEHHVPTIDVTACESPRELLQRADLIIAATTSEQPVLPDDPALLANKHFISVGSYRPTMQELPDSVYRLAGGIAIDSEHARHEVGDVINPVHQGWVRESDVFSIAECVAGRRVIDRERTTVYKSVGSAIFDLFVGQALYRAAKSRGLGVEIEL